MLKQPKVRADNGPDSVPQRLTLGDWVYEQIFELIVTGEFAVGTRLPTEIELAARFKVSRPIVREALGRLRDDGLIVSRQGSGSYVQRRPDTATLGFADLGSIADIQRCFEFREAIEGVGAGLAAARRDNDDVVALERLVRQLAKEVASGSLGMEVDLQFHRLVAEAARNRFFLTAFRSLERHTAFAIRLARSLSLSKPKGILQTVQREHEDIFEAIRGQDAETARSAMIQHLVNARRRVFDDAAELSGDFTSIDTAPSKSDHTASE